MNFFLDDNPFSECTSASYFLTKIEAFLYYNWYSIVDNDIKADYIIINTCWVFKELESKYINYIDNILNNYWNKKKIIVVWCLVSTSSIIKKYKDCITLIWIKELNKLNDIFFKTIHINEITSIHINNLKVKKQCREIENNNNKFFIEISRGCIHKCSYCVIKKSIWYVKSNNIGIILNECIEAIKLWYNEIVLVSDDCASYWLDIGLSFDIIFNKIAELDWDFTIDINYVEPWLFIKLFPLIKENFHKVSVINIPVQSFNDRILKMMSRNYSVEDYLNIIYKIKKYWSKDIILYNQIIFWYPTETYNEFKNNFKYIKLFNNNLYNLFSYFPWTRTFEKKDFISRIDQKKRIEILLKFSRINHKFISTGFTY